MAVMATTACDPCADLAGCERPAAAALTGRIVSFPAEKGVVGVRITLSAAGVAGEALTDRDGFWRVELPLPASVGPVTARAEVLAPGLVAPYLIEGIPIAVSKRRGESFDIGRWYDRPQLRFVGEVRPRLGVNLEGATVQVDRVGGVEGEVKALVSPIGADRRFIVEAPAAGLGTMLLRLAFRLPGVAQPFVHDSMPVRTMVRDTAANVQGVFSVGAGFLYRLRVLRRGTSAGVPGVSVTFRRISGPRVVSDEVQATTDGEGYASLPLEPLERGVVVGTLTLRGSGFPPEIVEGLRYPTVDDDSPRFAGNFSVGVQDRKSVV